MSIGEALFREVDKARHQELIDLALELIRDHEAHAPRIDTGEWVISAQERVDDLQDFLNLTADPPLRRVEIDYDSGVRRWCAILEPSTHPLMGKKDTADADDR
jgi:CO/xanthine dehydrogenase Mo-binding subunit